jgi:hypothetical protein
MSTIRIALANLRFPATPEESGGWRTAVALRHFGNKR